MQQKIKFENLDPDLASRLQFPPCGAYAPCWEPLLYTQVGFQRASWNLPKLKGLTRQASFETVKRKQTEHLTFTEWSSIWYWRREGPFKWHTHYGSFRYFEKEVAPCGLNVFQHFPPDSDLGVERPGAETFLIFIWTATYLQVSSSQKSFSPPSFAYLLLARHGRSVFIPPSDDSGDQEVSSHLNRPAADGSTRTDILYRPVSLTDDQGASANSSCFNLTRLVNFGNCRYQRDWKLIQVACSSDKVTVQVCALSC